MDALAHTDDHSHALTRSRHLTQCLTKEHLCEAVCNLASAAAAAADAKAFSPWSLAQNRPCCHCTCANSNPQALLARRVTLTHLASYSRSLRQTCLEPTPVSVHHHPPAWTHPASRVGKMHIAQRASTRGMPTSRRACRRAQRIPASSTAPCRLFNGHTSMLG